MKIAALFLLVFSFSTAWAEEVIGVLKDIAQVYDQPRQGGVRIGYLPKGRRLKFETTKNPNFLSIRSKGGRVGYVEARQVDLSFYEGDPWDATLAQSAAAAKEENKEVAPPPLPEPESLSREESEPSFSPRLTYDLGVSGGKINNLSYTEINLGLNWFFKEWIAWRNAAFYRIIEGDDYYGLDTSARLFHFFKWGRNSGATLFGGPGYRFASKGDDLPFAEAGLILKLGGFSLGGGAKSFYPDLVGSKMSSDTQFFIILSGSGSIF